MLHIQFFIKYLTCTNFFIIIIITILFKLQKIYILICKNVRKFADEVEKYLGRIILNQ